MENNKLELIQDRLKIVEANLPHRNLHKFYPCTRELYNYQGDEAFLVAPNQIGKSSIQIKLLIEWITNIELWNVLWPEVGRGKNSRYFLVFLS